MILSVPGMWEGENTNIMNSYLKVLSEFRAGDERERAEQEMILSLAEREGDNLLLRSCLYAHLTASSIILNRDRTKTLFVWHNIYKSWAWTGGHCDGDPDFERVARREAAEETGIGALTRIGEGVASMEILPVHAHMKRGRMVGTHLHLNVSYLFEAEETWPLRICPEENRDVRWIEIADIERMCTEPDMIPVYLRLIRRANVC